MELLTFEMWLRFEGLDTMFLRTMVSSGTFRRKYIWTHVQCLRNCFVWNERVNLVRFIFTQLLNNKKNDKKVINLLHL